LYVRSWAKSQREGEEVWSHPCTGLFLSLGADREQLLVVRLHDLAEPVDQDVAASNAPFVQCNSYRQGKLGKGLSYLSIGLD